MEYGIWVGYHRTTDTKNNPANSNWCILVLPDYAPSTSRFFGGHLAVFFRTHVPPNGYRTHRFLLAPSLPTVPCSPA